MILFLTSISHFIAKYYFQFATAFLMAMNPSSLHAWTEPHTGIELVWIKGGCFDMGCGPWTSRCLAREKPVHRVCLDGFWLGKYEVTQGQWTTIMKNNTSEFTHGNTYPVEQVSWHKAREFILRLNKLSNKSFSLPTEAQWEYAARSGGKEEKYAGGDEIEKLGFHWFNSNKTTHPVGSKQPNGLGLYDMTGNVWEWCEDRYGKKYYATSQSDNPKNTANSIFRILRGGSWYYSPWYARTSNRLYSQASFVHSSIGFRILLQDNKTQ